MRKHQPSIAKNRHTALTLVEFAVVIAVIVLIVLILLPALGSTRGPSKRVMDMSNLRQIAIALVVYAEDHTDNLPEHPRDAKRHLDGESHDSHYIWLNPYQKQDAVIDRGDFSGGATRFGGYVFINLGKNISDMMEPSNTILAYTAKATLKQTNRNVAFADGHVESWEEDQLRSSLPEGIDVEALDGP